MVMTRPLDGAEAVRRWCRDGAMGSAYVGFTWHIRAAGRAAATKRARISDGLRRSPAGAGTGTPGTPPLPVVKCIALAGRGPDRARRYRYDGGHVGAASTARRATGDRAQSHRAVDGAARHHRHGDAAGGAAHLWMGRTPLSHARRP